MDFETSSGNKDIKSLNPWKVDECRICGISIKSDGSPIYYIPVRHNRPYDRYNLPRQDVINWLREIFASHARWINQNVKYDAHCAWNDFELEFRGEYICTINARAKLYDSERQFKGGYGLDVLTLAYLNRDIKPYEERLQPYLQHSKDYGDICPLVLGEYAIEDVRSVFDLEEFFPHETVEQLEINATKALIHMERAGVMVEELNIEKEKMRCVAELYGIEMQIFKQLGVNINPSSHEELADAMLNIFGLPVLEWTDEETKLSPSFKKNVLKDYLEVEDAPIWFIEKVIRYRSIKTYNGLFLEAYAEKNIDGVLHASYNQTIRTGRMSCSNPNLTQCDGRAKALVVPGKGRSIARYDYSQIEFRIIAQYIKFLEGYGNNPDLDFYDGVASKAGCDRPPAKIIALASGYGMGIKKLIRSLKAIKSVKQQVLNKLLLIPAFLCLDKDQQKAALNAALERHCVKIYNDFHNGLPSMKKTFDAASNVCKQKGFVRTMMGRKRHLTAEFSNKAFNAACQGSAADLIKLKIFELWQLLEGTPVDLVLQVHDELVFIGPSDIIEDPRFSRDTIAIMEENPLPMVIPIRAAGGYSHVSWRQACWNKEREIKNPFGEKGERYSWFK